MKLPRFNATLFIILLQVSRVSAQDIRFERVDLPDINIQNVITGITQDLQGNIWFAANAFSGGSGLFEYDGVHLKSYTHDPLNPSSLANNLVECIYADKRGNLWIGTWGGLDKLDPATGVFIHYKHDAKNVASLSGDTVTCILQDHEGMLWIGTRQAGLNRLDTKTGKFTRYRHNDRDSTSLSFDQVRALYEDREGTLWVGTGSAFVDADGNPERKGGLNRFNKNSKTFTRYLHNKNDPHSLIDNPVRAIYEDSYGIFWVGTSGDGLHTMDRATGSFTRYNYDPKHPEKLSRPPLFDVIFDHITFITEDAKGAIWIGAFWGGLVRYDPRKNKVERYQLDTAHASDYTNTTWWEFTSRDGEMWVSNFFAPGIFRFDPAHENAAKIRTETYMTAFIEEQDSIQWIGTFAGLAHVNKKNNDTAWFRHDAQKAGSISNDSINVYIKTGKTGSGQEHTVASIYSTPINKTLLPGCIIRTLAQV